uniref:Uncharacterized protein n=1 Tax=Solibacter usitatus (strain Ellin6076) TaxID=234267 RepID=Q01VX4_SOLUE
MSPQDLQFQRAEPVAPEPSPDDLSPRCVVCKHPTGNSYFHAQGLVVCPGCAEQIRTGQQAPPAVSLMRAALYGGGAALAGCLLYAVVAIVLNAEIGLIAILVGYMVGRAIRHAGQGRGGRPQQILAVILTYFAITTSYIPVYIYHAVKNPRPAITRQQPGQGSPAPAVAEKRPASFGSAVVVLLLLAAVAPFLSLGSSGVSGLISLFIIFIGLQRAWRLTGRSEILIMGPYPVEAAQ